MNLILARSTVAMLVPGFEKELRKIHPAKEFRSRMNFCCRKLCTGFLVVRSAGCSGGQILNLILVRSAVVFAGTAKMNLAGIRKREWWIICTTPTKLPIPLATPEKSI